MGSLKAYIYIFKSNVHEPVFIWRWSTTGSNSRWKTCNIGDDFEVLFWCDKQRRCGCCTDLGLGREEAFSGWTMRATFYNTSGACLFLTEFQWWLRWLCSTYGTQARFESCWTANKNPWMTGVSCQPDGLENIIGCIKRVGFTYVKYDSDFCCSKEVHWFKSWVFSFL